MPQDHLAGKFPSAVNKDYAKLICAHFLTLKDYLICTVMIIPLYTRQDLPPAGQCVILSGWSGRIYLHTSGGCQIVEVEVETLTVLDVVRLNPPTTADTCGSQVLTADHLVYPHELLEVCANLKCLISRRQTHCRHISHYDCIRLNFLLTLWSM